VAVTAQARHTPTAPTLERTPPVGYERLGDLAALRLAPNLVLAAAGLTLLF
jgi:hypothetical protein